MRIFLIVLNIVSFSTSIFCWFVFGYVICANTAINNCSIFAPWEELMATKWMVALSLVILLATIAYFKFDNRVRLSSSRSLS